MWKVYTSNLDFLQPSFLELCIQIDKQTEGYMMTSRSCKTCIASYMHGYKSQVLSGIRNQYTKFELSFLYATFHF